ncbi:MAG: cold shock and DUF1294 domain-containing protein [Xanthomonadales bacterium]|nr:cold shock and DUF1294 domain-containing protein [Xanthomonadales bacterium]
MRYQGRLGDWNDDKGFGFVVPNGGGDRAFVHIKAFARASRRPLDGDLITYTVTRDARGRLQANAIRFVGDTAPADDRAKPGWFGPVFALLFVATLAGTVFTGQLPMNLLLAYAAVSAIAFIVYGLDKSAATAGRQRTPESRLHFLGFICGWPGALLAQRVFRHKSRKAAFQSTFWGTVALNVIALLLLASDTGRAWVGF